MCVLCNKSYKKENPKMVWRGVLGTWPAWRGLLLTCLVFLAHVCADTAALQELLRVNVTSQQENKTVLQQVAFNISFDRGQMNLNGFPLNKGVSRISCNMNTVNYGSPYEQRYEEHEALVSMRLLLFHQPMNSSTGETKIILQQEVVELNRNQVYQNQTMEINLVVTTDMQIHEHTISTVLLKDTLLNGIPRASDVLFTFPNLPQAAGESVPQETTREYIARHNTTMDEDPFPGKLPETPLQAVIPDSSYKVMCQFADDLRNNLCVFWNIVYPELLKLIEVFIVGVITAAIVLQLLQILYPSKEQKGILQPSDLKDSALLVPLL